MEDKIIKVFTDGSCLRNGKKNAKAGIGIYFPNDFLNNISEEFTCSPITNQRAELYAILVTLNLIVEKVEFDKIIVYTDSLYSIKCLTEWIKKWEKQEWKTSTNKPVKNLDIILPIHKIIAKYNKKIVFKHVKSHTGKQDFKSKGNDKADKLATSAIK